MESYDGIVVGSGTGGQTAARALNGRGLKVAVVESSDRPGGTCALAGCQPKNYDCEAADDDRILGAHGICDNATGIINSFRLAMLSGMRLPEYDQHAMMTPYPTWESDILSMLEPLLQHEVLASLLSLSCGPWL